MFDDDLPLAIPFTALGWPIQVALARSRTAYIPKDALVGWEWEWEHEGGREKRWYRGEWKANNHVGYTNSRHGADRADSREGDEQPGVDGKI